MIMEGTDDGATADLPTTDVAPPATKSATGTNPGK
jgi:hypothetical protein